MTQADITIGPGADPKAIYDALMAIIDPELTTEHLEGLKEKYADESEEDRSARADRYKKAFKAFEGLSSSLFGMVGEFTAISKRTALASAEAKSRAEDQEVLDDLESHFDH